MLVAKKYLERLPETEQPYKQRVPIESLLQICVYKASDIWEQDQESVNPIKKPYYSPTLDDLLIRYIKFLVWQTTIHNSCYVAVGQGCFLYTYRPGEIANLAIDHFDEGNIRRNKSVILGYIKKRFARNNIFRNNLDLDTKPPNEDERNLIHESLTAFTPWLGPYSASPIPSKGILDTYFSLASEKTEWERSHVLIDPIKAGLAAMIREYNKLFSEISGMRLEDPDNKLCIPIFKGAPSSSRNRHDFDPLGKGEFDLIRYSLERKQRRRQILYSRQMPAMRNEPLPLISKDGHQHMNIPPVMRSLLTGLGGTEGAVFENLRTLYRSLVVELHDIDPIDLNFHLEHYYEENVQADPETKEYELLSFLSNFGGGSANDGIPFSSYGSGHFGDRRNPYPLSPVEKESIRKGLDQKQHRRGASHFDAVRVFVDCEELLQLNSCTPLLTSGSRRMTFRVPANAFWVEVFGEDKEGEILLAAFPLPQLESANSVQVQRMLITHEGGSTIELSVSPIIEQADECTEALIQISYLLGCCTKSDEALTERLIDKEPNGTRDNHEGCSINPEKPIEAKGNKGLVAHASAIRKLTFNVYLTLRSLLEIREIGYQKDSVKRIDTSKIKPNIRRSKEDNSFGHRLLVFTVLVLMIICVITVVLRLVSLKHNLVFRTQKFSNSFEDAWGPRYKAQNNAPGLKEAKTKSLKQVLRWNGIANDASGLDHTPVKVGENRVFGEQLGPGRSSRAMAIVHIAMFEALNAITGDFESYTGLFRASKETSGKAAVAQAAHDTLAAMFPSQKASFDSLLAEDLNELPNNRAKTNGIALGRTAAFSILARRSLDGSQVVESRVNIDFICDDEPGKWRQDPVSLIPLALGARWGEVSPFVLQSPSQFRVPPPPAMDSPEYAAAFNEVKQLGGDGITTPTVRTAEQTEIGIYWAYDGTPSLSAPPRLYNQIAVQIAEQMGSNEVELARLLALVNTAMADAAIAIWDSKYFYQHWRPVTGIREADAGTGTKESGDGNPGTVGDVTFSPLGAPASNLTGPNFTPPFPSYPSEHAGFGAALFETLRNFYGTDSITFTFVSDEFNGETLDNKGNARPLVPRSFTSLSQAEEENGQSRIYLGINWSFDKTQSIAQSRNIADYVFKHMFLPIRGKTERNEIN